SRQRCGTLARSLEIVLLDDDGSGEAAILEHPGDGGNIDRAVRKRTHDACLQRFMYADLPIQHAPADCRIDILQMHVADAVPNLFHIGKRVLAPERMVARVEAESDVGVLQQPVDLTLELDRGRNVRMERE